MNSFALTIQLPAFNPVLTRQHGYEVVTTVAHANVTSAVETPEWPTGNETFYDTRTSSYTWDDVVLTPAELRNASFNEAVHHATQQRLQKEKQGMAWAIQELAKVCSDPSHVIRICDWV